MKVKDIMTPNPEKVQPNDTVQRAAKLMKGVDIGCVPVLENGNVVGMLTDRDIAIRLAAEGKSPADTNVAEIMSGNVIACSEDDDATTAGQMMKQNQLRRLLVKDTQGAIVGVVSLGDLATSLKKEEAGEVIREVSQPAEPAR